MSDTPNRDAKLVQLLNEAYAKERQLEIALADHAESATREDYAKQLKAHLKETKSHASVVSRRIKQLGGTPEMVSLPGPEGLAHAAETVAGALGKAKAAAQGSLHAMRGSGEQAKMLHNARVEYAQEAEEIATYLVIESLAATVGDKETAKLARDIRREEERMQKFLTGLLPELSADVAHDTIPVSEIDGPAAHRTASSGRA
jgi:ferritin-like metal-binding protein YciE